ncbi:MAG TPA: hypothetical protein VFB72_15050, partial [Verrucomicrobiae bacterium]|nr:hypothetical protein [Verrucomicrobiae bacterium]
MHGGTGDPPVPVGYQPTGFLMFWMSKKNCPASCRTQLAGSLFHPAKDPLGEKPKPTHIFERSEANEVSLTENENHNGDDLEINRQS